MGATEGIDIYCGVLEKLISTSLKRKDDSMYYIDFRGMDISPLSGSTIWSTERLFRFFELTFFRFISRKISANK